MNMNLKKLLITASAFVAGTAIAVLFPVSAEAATMVSGGASRELGTTSRTANETAATHTSVAQITDPADVIEEEYLSLSIALFESDPKYCNVRSGPGTEYSIVGRMYDGSVGSVIDEYDENIAGDPNPDEDNEEWVHVRSGQTEGYVLSNFVVTGVAAYNRLEDYTQYYAEIQVSQLNVRKEASIDSECLTYVTRGERYRVVVEDGMDPRVYLAAKESDDPDDDGMNWIKIVYSGDKVGYVSADYITITEEYKTARTIEEIREEEAAERERNLRATTTSGNNGGTQNYTAPAENLTRPDLTTDYASTSELRMAIVNYALQFVGNPYILGGQSLAGTDCSGFVCYDIRLTQTDRFYRNILPGIAYRAHMVPLISIILFDSPWGVVRVVIIGCIGPRVVVTYAGCPVLAYLWVKREK